MSFLIFLIVCFLVCSGVLAAVDAALMSVTRPEIHELVRHKKTGAIALQSVKDRFRRAVVVIVLITNIVNVMGPILVTQQTVNTPGAPSLSVIAAVLMLGTITVSEIIPKAMGAHYAPLISRIAAPVIHMLQFVLFPVVIALEWLSGHFTAGTRRIGTEDQICSLTTIGQQAGYIEEDERRLIQRAFVLNDRTAADIMTPLKNVIGLAQEQSIADAAQVLRQAIYSRYPVFGKDHDEILGIVMIRDLLEAAAEQQGDDPIRSVARPAFFVSSTMRCDDLLIAFRNRHMHLAIVRDNRHTVGVVSLEDVLEELVGEIEDERDADDCT